MERDEGVDEQNRKKARGEELHPVRAGWLTREALYQPSESFIPCPKITFIIYKPRNLLCQICHESRLEPRTDRVRPTDRTPSILPCGHVAGLRCLSRWFSHLLADGKSPCCPFCRVNLEYPECGHPVPERPVTRENIYLLPPTLQDGGVLPKRCWDCSKPGLRLEVYSLMRPSSKLGRRQWKRAWKKMNGF